MAEDTSIEDLNKAQWKPKFQSEFSMGTYDFERYNHTLMNIEILSVRVNSCHIPSLELMQFFFAELINLYDNFRPLISFANVTTELDVVVDKGIKLKRTWERTAKMGATMNNKIILDFVDLCRALKTKLYNIKQVMGLGIVVKRNMTISEKIRRGIHGDSDFGNLPEA